MKRPKMVRRVVYLYPDEDRELVRRAAAHGLKPGKYLRSWLNNRRPGSDPGTGVAAADDWWDTRTPERREAIHRFHAAKVAPDPVPADQLCIALDGSPL